MESEPDVQVRGRALIQVIEPRLCEAHRIVLVEWAEKLLAIRTGSGSPVQKARQAIRETYRREVVLALLTTSASSMKDVAWDDRSWSARLGIGVATVTAATVGSQGAGIAALGSAVGVPLWIVLGAGGSFAGMLIDELSKALPERPRPSPTVDPPDIVDADWEIVDPDLEADLLADLQNGSLVGLLQSGEPTPEATREPLWKVFRSAYRAARQKQRHSPDSPGTPPPHPEGLLPQAPDDPSP